MTKIRIDAGGGRGKTARRAFTVLLSATALGSAFMVVALSVSSCAARVEATLKADGGARVSVASEVPPALAAKLRKLAQIPSDAPLFDVAAIKKSLAARSGLSLIDLVLPTPETLRAEISVQSLKELASEADLRSSGLLTITRGKDWIELRVRLARGGAHAVAALFPGLDPYLIDALSPPALEEDPVNAEEYRSMLKSVLGEKAMPSMEAASVAVSLVAPGNVIASGGGSLEGNKLSLKIPVIDALVLEKPVEFWLRWKI